MAYADNCLSDNTRRAYASGWRRFAAWCDGHTREPLPATPDAVAEYLSMLANTGKRVATIKQARAAIDYRHKQEGHVPPGASLNVENTMKGICRAIGVQQEQKRGLTADIFVKVLNVCDDFETLAILATMRDGMLRVSELTALKVKHFTPLDNESGRIEIKRSKTDQFGEGAVQYLSKQTTAMVIKHIIETDRKPEHYLFGLKSRPLYRKNLERRIKRAVWMAGYEPEYFSTHSPRIGMAQDLEASGATGIAIANSGRWADTRMVCAYTRNQQAGRSAVAQFYGEGT